MNCVIYEAYNTSRNTHRAVQAQFAFVGAFQGVEALVPVLKCMEIDEYKPDQEYNNVIHSI